MPIQAELLTDDPIILVTFYGEFSAEDAREAYQHTAEIQQEFDGMIYRIHDMRAADMSFPNIVAVIQEARKGEPGSTIDERVQDMIVGRSGLFDVARAAFAQAGKAIPVFDSVQAAIDAIHVGILGMQEET